MTNQPTLEEALRQVPNNPSEALKLFDAILSQRADDADAEFGRATALSRLGRYRDAADAFYRSSTLRPGSSEALYLWASHEFLAGDKARALDAWTWVANRVEKKAEAWLHVATLAESLGDYARELSAREALASVQPSPDALLGLALAERRMGRHADAVRSFQRIETMEPGYLEKSPSALQAFHHSKQSIH